MSSQTIKAVKPETNESSVSTEAQALAALTQARQEREQRCSEEVNRVLVEHNCQLTVSLQVGEQLVALNRVVALPGMVQVVSR